MKKIIITISLLFCCVYSLAIADDEEGTAANPIVIPQKTTEIILDGTVGDAEWARAWQYSLDYEVNPGDSIPAPVKTVVYMTYDDDAVYFGFKCYDPDPSKIRAVYTDRDNIGGADWCGVVLDTFNDERRDYLLLVTPTGVQLDRIETANGNAVWDGIWDCKSVITEWGWSTEIRLPFNSIRFQQTDGPQTWGFDAVRGYPRDIFRQMGAFRRDRNNNNYQSQLIKISGFDGVEPGRNIELIPTMTTFTHDQRNDMPFGSMENSERETEFGVTGEWGISPNMVLSGTLNPDFSQVEADSRQLDINEPFALRFDEKRPFFMEGSDYFQTRMRAIYTRMMRQPNWGVKLTGKEGGNTFGAYLVEDDITNLIFPGATGSRSTSLNMKNKSAVMRYKRDIGNQYTIGAMATLREGEDNYYNRLVGADGIFRVTNTDQFQVQALATSTQYSDSVARQFNQPTDEFGGICLDLLYFHSERNWHFYTGMRELDSEFRADLGFMPWVGYRLYFFGGQYEWRNEENPDSWWTEFQVESENAYRQDEQGDLLTRQYELRLRYHGPWQSMVLYNYYDNCNAYGGQIFDGTDHSVTLRMRPLGSILLAFDAMYGDKIDYDNIRQGTRYRLDPGMNWHVTRHLFLSASHTYEQLDAEGDYVYKANISQGSLVYQFNTRMFVRGILQYVNYDYNVSNYSFAVEPTYEDLFTQFLFSYKINPQTVFFLGYTDNYQGREDYTLTQENRTVFMKIGYSWQL